MKLQGPSRLSSIKKLASSGGAGRIVLRTTTGAALGTLALSLLLALNG
jgi:hypothetical protein